MFYLLDIIGIMVFVMLGVLIVMYKKLDLFGVFIIVFVIVVGGGIFCDVLIGRILVGWMLDL